MCAWYFRVLHHAVVFDLFINKLYSCSIVQSDLLTRGTGIVGSSAANYAAGFEMKHALRFNHLPLSVHACGLRRLTLASIYETTKLLKLHPVRLKFSSVAFFMPL